MKTYIFTFLTFFVFVLSGCTPEMSVKLERFAEDFDRAVYETDRATRQIGYLAEDLDRTRKQVQSLRPNVKRIAVYNDCPATPKVTVEAPGITRGYETVFFSTEPGTSPVLVSVGNALADEMRFFLKIRGYDGSGRFVGSSDVEVNARFDNSFGYYSKELGAQVLTVKCQSTPEDIYSSGATMFLQ